MGRKLDLQHLSEEECERILQVIQKDFELRQKEKERLNKAEDSLDTEVKKTTILTQKEEFNATCCIRCCRVFGIIFNRRQTCLNCKLHVCKNCSEYRDKEKGCFCHVCIQSLDLKKQSCDWFYTNVQQRFKRFGSAKVVRSLYKPDGTSDIDPVILEALQNSGSVKKKRPPLHEVFTRLNPLLVPSGEELSLNSESDQSKSLSSVPSPRAFSTPQPVTLTKEERDDRSRYVKDIYEEQRVSAQKREDEEAEKFRQKFESTLAELYRTLDNQTPSGENFQGQNYGDFVANYRNQFKDLLSNLSDSLQKIHKRTNGQTDKAEQASHIRQTLSKVVENAVGDSMDWGSDEAVSDLSSSTDDGRENEDSAYADQLASVLLAKVVDKHRKAAEERERRRQKEREREEQKERERERKEREKARERERKEREQEQREKDRAQREELEKAKQRQKEIKEQEEQLRLEAERESERLKEEEEAKKRFNYDDEFEKLIKFSQGASARPKAKPREIEEKVEVALAQEAPIVKVTRAKEEADVGFIDRVLSLEKLSDSHAKLPDFSYTGSLGFNEVDPDLMTLSHSEFEDNGYDEGDYVSDNSGRHSGRPWQDNWIFGQDGARTKTRSAVQRVKSDLSDSMYVHVPEKDVSPRVGETDAEDLSDLSENEDKDEIDHSDNSDADAPYYAQTSTEIERVLKRVERTSSVTDSFIHTDESDFDVSKSSSQLRAMKSGRKSTDPSLKLRLSESLDTSVQSDDSSVLSIQERKEELKSSQKFQEMLIPSEKDDPKFDLPPESTTALEGEAIKLVCRVSGTEPIDVFWYLADDDELHEITDSEKCDVSTDGSRYTLTMYNPTRADAGQYTCVALSDTGRCCQYFVVKVKENTQEMKAPEFMRGIDDLEVTEGRSAKFRCKVKGYPQPRVTWYKDGQRITKADKDYKIDKFGNRDYSLGVEYVTLDHDAEYTVKATNLAGECKQCAQLLVIEHSEVIEKETKLKTAMNLSSSNMKNKPGLTNQRKEEQQIANLSQKMEMTRNGVSEVAEDMLSTAGEKIAAGNVRAVTSTAFGVLQSAEDVIQREKSNQNFVERKSLRDAYVKPDVTDTLTVDVKMKGVEREESKTSIDSGVFSITGDDRNGNNFQRTSSQRYDSKRSGDIGHLDSALDIFSDSQARNQSANHNKKSELQMNFSSNRTAYSPPKDLTFNSSGSSSLTSPRGAISPRGITSPRGVTPDTDDEKIVFGLQPVNRKYSRDYVINTDDAQSQKKKWEVNLNSYSPRAEIVNRKPEEEVKNTEDKIYMTAGTVYSLEDKVQNLEKKVKADSRLSAEDLEDEIARTVAQVEQNEKEVHRVETVVAQLKQEVPSDVQFPTPKPRKLQSGEANQGSSLTVPPNQVQALVSQSEAGSVPESQSEFDDGQYQLPSVNRLKNMFSQSGPSAGDSAFRRDSNMVHSITARSFNKQRLSEFRERVHSPEPESTADADIGETEVTSVSGEGSTKKYRAPQPPTLNVQPVEATKQPELNRSPQESVSPESDAKPNTTTSSSVRTGTTKARAAFWDKRIQNEIASDELVSEQFPSMVDESRLIRRKQDRQSSGQLQVQGLK